VGERWARDLRLYEVFEGEEKKVGENGLNGNGVGGRKGG
jgi:hypothetical protein